MRVLLDTCALIWAVYAPASLSAKARRVIVNPQNQILISAASAGEIATKFRLGKLPGVERLEQNFSAILYQAGYTPLPIEMDCALRAGRMTAPHRDPFDHMIAAQALAYDIPVVTPDEQFGQFGVRRLW